MFYHYDNRSYETAASDTAQRARTKLEGIIQRGQQRAAELMNKLEREVPCDRLVSPQALNFEVNGRFEVALGDDRFALHPHARGQVINATKGLLTRRVADAMVQAGDWGKELLSDALNRIYGHLNRERVLMREVDGEVRAVLPDRYRRMDSAHIVESFAGSCGAVGAVPVESHASATKWSLKVLLPQVSSLPLPTGERGDLAQVGVEELPEMMEFDERPTSDGVGELLGLLRRLYQEGHLDQIAFWQLSSAIGL